ncbi:hypothetical protein FOC4_g10001910, partial [Fusarium odoratissimum]
NIGCDDGFSVVDHPIECDMYEPKSTKPRDWRRKAVPRVDTSCFSTQNTSVIELARGER